MLSTLTSVYGPRLVAILKDRKGVSAMEYAVLAVAIVVAVGTAAGLLAHAFTGTMATVTGEL